MSETYYSPARISSKDLEKLAVEAQKQEKIINEYSRRRQSQDYISSDDIRGYSAAIRNYSNMVDALQKFGVYGEDNERKRAVSQLKSDVSSAAGLFSQFTDENQYRAWQKINKVEQMSLEDIKPFLNKNKNGIAYISLDGKNVTWQSLYDRKKKAADAAALYDEISSRDDFEEYVKKGFSIKNPTFEEASGRFSIGPWRFGEKEIDNVVTFSKDNIGSIRLGEFNSANPPGSSEYTYMTDEEIKLYNYFLSKEGKKKAAEYLNSLDLKERRNTDVLENTVAAVQQEFPMLAPIMARMTSLGSGLEYVADSVKSTFTGEVDRNHLSDASAAYDSIITDKIDLEIAGWDAFDFIYSTAMSGADSMASGALFGPTGGGIALGLSAAAQGTNAALDRGLNKKQAFLTGFFSGVFEGMFEKISLGHWLKPRVSAGFKGFAKNIASSMLVNASEEAATELANIAYDTFVNTDFSEYSTLVRQYENTGISKEEAEKKAKGDMLGRVLESAASGALMGAGMSGVDHASMSASATTAAKAIKSQGKTKDVINLGKSFSDGTLSKKLAGKISENSSAYQIGKLLRAEGMELSKQNISEITKALVDRGFSAEKASEVSKWFEKVVEGGRLTKKETDALKYSEDIGEAFRDLVFNENSVVNQRTSDYSNLMQNPSLVKNSVVDTADTDGYNNGGGEDNAISDGGRALSGDTSSEGTHSGTAGEGKTSWREDEESFLRRAQSNSDETGRGRRTLLKSGDTYLSFVAGTADNTPGYGAADMLARSGVKVVYVDGPMQSHKNGMTTEYTQALTAPDGTVYVSSEATLTDVKLAAHEIVHVYDNSNALEYTAFETALCENVLWGSKKYFEIAEEINNSHYGGKYDIESTDFASKFIRELSAYVNEFIVADVEQAQRNFAMLFSDWDEILNACEKFNKDIKADYSQSAFSMPETAPADGDTESSVFREPAVRDIATEPDKQDYFDAMLGKDKTAKQRHIERVAEKLGTRIVWNDKFSRGTYNPATKTITLNPNTLVGAAYIEIFKHEFTHHLEQRSEYGAFRKYLFEESVAFEDYCRKKLTINGYSTEGSRADIIARYTEHIYSAYKNSSEIPKAIRDKFTREDAEKEMTADFVGTCLFADKNTDALSALEEIAQKRPNFIERMIEAVKRWLNNLGKDKHTRMLREDIALLEKRLGEVYRSAQQKNTAENSGVKYYVASDVVDLSNDKKLSKRVEGLHGAAKYKEIRDYILEELGDREIQLSDGKNAIVDRRDALHIANKAGKDKTAQISSLVDVICRAKLYAEAKNVEHNKFNYFCYYLATVRYGEDVYPIYLNVGRGRTDGKYHIYDITKKIRDTAHRVNDVGRPVGNALENDISNSSISNPAENVKDEKYSINTDKINTDNVSAYAGRVLRQNQSSLDRGELTDRISEIISSADSGNWGQAMRLATRAAQVIIDSSRMFSKVSADSQTILDEIRNTPVALNAAQRKEAAYYFGSYNEYRKKQFGRIKLKNEAILLDKQWQEWAEKYPHIFEADMKDVDMPSALASIVEALKTDFENADTDGAVTYLAEKLFTEAVATRGNPRTALDDAIADLKKKHTEEVRGLRKDIAQKERRIEQQNKQLKLRRDEIRKQEAARINERRDKQKNIEYIRREVAKIDKKFRQNSEKAPVLEHLKDVVGEFCKVFLKNDQSVFKRSDLDIIHAAYARLGGEYKAGGETLIGSYDVDIDTMLLELGEALDGKRLRDISAYNLAQVRDIVDHFRHIIVNENKLFVQGRSAELQEVGTKAYRELRQKRGLGFINVMNGVDKIKQFLVNNNITPIYFFERLGHTFSWLFDDLRDGQDTWYRNMRLAKEHIGELKQKYHYSEWDDKTFKFTTVYGDKIELTVEQAMLLYATAKREKLNEVQKAQHLFKGGVVIDYDKTAKGAVKRLQRALLAEEKNAEKNKGAVDRVISAFYDELDVGTHQITPVDVGRVNEWLTDEQRTYADSMVDYLSKDMAALGNNTSMKMFGFCKFNEQYYIPYNSARNYLFSQPGITSEQRLKHQSFTKQTQTKAGNPLLLSDFSTVCADHINRMCMYNALTIPLENLNRVFNYKTPGEEGGVKSTAIKTEIERVYGAGAVRYFEQFLLDMNGNVRTSSVDSYVNKGIALFKKGSVFASASVVVQQPSAIVRAMALIDPKYFVTTTFAVAERDYKQLIKYAPVAGIKEMGRFDTGVGIQNTVWLLEEKPVGLSNKVKAFLDPKDSSYRDDKFSFFAAKADEITWAHIWAAVKAETAEKTDLDTNSEEFLESCGKRFRDIIDRTQVYDSVLARSHNMRSNSATAKMITAFMAEPTVSFNLLMDGLIKYKTGTKEGKKYFGRTVGAFIGTTVLNSLLKSLVTAARDDDEEESYWEKYVADFIGNLADDIFIPNLIPFARDIVSLWTGYSVERTDMSLFEDFIDSVKDLTSEEMPTLEKTLGIISSVGAFLGLPIKNLLRDAKAIYNVANRIVSGDNPTTLSGVGFAIQSAFGVNDSKTKLYRSLAAAAQDNDEEKYQRIYKHLIEKGVEESDIRKGTKSAIKKGKDVVNKTEQYISQLENNDSYDALEAEDQKKIKNNISTELAREVYVKSTDKFYDEYDKMYAALRKGNKALYQQLKNSLLKKGATKSQIDDGVDVARIAYLKSVGIDLHEYILAKMAMSEKYADTDGSGGVSQDEKKKAIRSLDLDRKVINQLLKNLS